MLARETLILFVSRVLLIVYIKILAYQLQKQHLFNPIDFLIYFSLQKGYTKLILTLAVKTIDQLVLRLLILLI